MTAHKNSLIFDAVLAYLQDTLITIDNRLICRDMHDYDLEEIRIVMKDYALGRHHIVVSVVFYDCDDSISFYNSHCIDSSPPCIGYYDDDILESVFNLIKRHVEESNRSRYEEIRGVMRMPNNTRTTPDNVINTCS